MNTFKWPRFLCLLFLTLPLLAGVVSCGRQRQAQDDSSDNVEEPDRDLSFNNITLEQSDDEGELIWRMIADRAVYSQDRRVATIENPSGEFFQDDDDAPQTVEQMKNDIAHIEAMMNFN